MKPLDYPLVADENIHSRVITFLRQDGRLVHSISEEGSFGQSDEAILAMAHRQKSVVLTHDSDFGTLVISQGEPFTGIIYLRPGHISPDFTIESLKIIDEQDIEVEPPFIVVAQRQYQQVKIRIRQF